MNVTPSLVGSTLGSYAIEREIGAGGMATVYLAHDAKHARPVAIKVLNPELGAVLGAERFLSEIRTTANLQHPHLLPLFDSGEDKGLLFYVMPYLGGRTSANPPSKLRVITEWPRLLQNGAASDSR